MKSYGGLLNLENQFWTFLKMISKELWNKGQGNHVPMERRPLRGRGIKNQQWYPSHQQEGRWSQTWKQGKLKTRTRQDDNKHSQQKDATVVFNSSGCFIDALGLIRTCKCRISHTFGEIRKHVFCYVCVTTLATFVCTHMFFL